jgi:nitrogen fixation/metabolism regulation signal transduction histidine kinase
MLKNMSLKTKTFILLILIILLATLPLIFYYLKAMKGLTELGTDRDIEMSLQKSIDLEQSVQGKEKAALALKKYRQIKVLKSSIIKQVLVFSLFYFFAVILISIGLGFVFISKITRPLQKLSGAVKELAGDNLDITLYENIGGEIGYLIDSFNKMLSDLKVAREQRAIAERRATWQQVARTIAHEIKNPLTPIKLSTERMYDKFLNESKDFPTVIKSTSETILHEIDNLQKLVDTFHKYAKFPDPVLKTESINHIVTETIEMFKGENVEITENLDKDIPNLSLDKGQIRQAMTNFLKNAIQSFDGMAAPGKIQVTSRREDEKVIVSVEDNGCGIPEENLRRLFQPYFTTKKHGSGIGLALTERIISLHGGKILCESKVGEGTKFTILFKMESGK